MTLPEYAIYEQRCRDLFKKYPVSACSLIRNLIRYIPEGEEGLEWYIALSDDEDELLKDVKELQKMWDQ